MPINRRTFLKWAGASLVTGGAAVAGYTFAIEPRRVVTEHVKIPLRGLPSQLEGLRIVQLSDLHLQPYTQLPHIEHAISVSNALQPDIVVLTGDYVLSDINAIYELAPVLARLQANYGIYAIYGNHDLWFPRNRETMEAGFARAGIPLLQNEAVTLSISDEHLSLVGLDDGWSGQPDLPAVLAQCPQDATLLVLMHEPDFALEYAPKLAGRTALQLSGHTHGGQVRFPFIGAPVLPYLGEHFDAGLFDVAGLPLYVNRGIGTVGRNVRFMCPPEVSEITLISA